MGTFSETFSIFYFETWNAFFRYNLNTATVHTYFLRRQKNQKTPVHTQKHWEKLQLNLQTKHSKKSNHIKEEITNALMKKRAHNWQTKNKRLMLITLLYVDWKSAFTAKYHTFNVLFSKKNIFKLLFPDKQKWFKIVRSFALLFISKNTDLPVTQD